MLRKIAIVLLLNVYALSSFGIGIREFYCCGKLKSTNISFVEHSNKKCGNGNENDGCCKTKYKAFKGKDSHIPADDLKGPYKNFLELDFLASSGRVVGLDFISKKVSFAGLPPPPENTPVYIFNCVYRI